MSWLLDHAEAEFRRLLRVLLVWVDKMPADPNARGMLLLMAVQAIIEAQKMATCPFS
jgi:hypothetical protein